MTDTVNKATDMVKASMSARQGINAGCHKNPTPACLFRSIR